MGAGYGSFSAAYGAGLAPAISPERVLVMSLASLALAALLMGALYAFLIWGGRGPKTTVARPRAPVAPPEDRGPDLLPIFTARLARLAALEVREDVRADAERFPLVRAALVSTYRDCVSLGAAAEADRVVEAARAGAPTPPPGSARTPGGTAGPPSAP